MMIKKTLFISLAITFIALSAFAQRSKQTRVEITVDNSWYEFKTIPCGDNGLILAYTYYDDERKSIVWKFDQYDTEMEKIWTGTENIDLDLQIANFLYDNESETLYILVSPSRLNVDGKRYIMETTDSPTLLFTLDFSLKETNLEVNKYENAFMSDLGNPQLYLADDKILVVGDPIPSYSSNGTCGGLFSSGSKKEERFLYPAYSFTTGENASSTPFKIKEIEDVTFYYIGSVINSEENISILMKADDYNEGYEKLLVYTLNPKASSISDTPLSLSEKEKDIRIIQANIYKYDEDKNFFFFTADSKEKGIIVVNGFINNDRIQNTETHQAKKVLGSYLTNNNFLSQETPLYIALHSDIHIINDDNDFMLIAEHVFPEYRQSSADGHSYSVLIGYKYMRASIMKFNEEGEFMEQEEFDMKKSYFSGRTIRPHLSVFPAHKATSRNKKYMLVMSHESNILSATMEDGKIKGRLRTERLSSKYSEKRIKKAEGNKTFHWYDNVFLATGEVLVKKSGKFLSGKEKKYYFNKIVFNMR